MTKKIQLLSLFSGIGAFEKALDRQKIPYELIGFCETNKWAMTSYCAIHNIDEQKNLGDIREINPRTISYCDVITHGSPCFRKGTLIKTNKKTTPIEKIKVGDMVLTHKLRFKKVKKIMVTNTETIYKLKIRNNPITYVTKEHPYYVREMFKISHNNSDYRLVFSKPKWKKVSELKKGDFIGKPVFLKEKKEENGIIIDNILWEPFVYKEKLNTHEDVYNFEVEDDNSYVANNCIVHNCQDFSVAGNGKGGDMGSDTRSSLMWHTVNIVKHKLPKYVIWENVKGVLSKKHKHNFNKYLGGIRKLGYNNYYEVLNAKNYGIPQNRERIFVISIRKDIDSGSFVFPEPFDNGLRLKDMLEDYVDEKYYIKKNRCEKLLKELKEKEISNSVRVGGRGSTDRHQWDLVVEKVENKNQDISYCIDANYAKGTTINDFLQKSRRQLVVTSDNPKYKIIQINNPKHFEPMFTLTANDRHGVIIKEACVLRKERTEYEKKYEAGKIKESISNMSSLQPRKDGASNTITTVQKDNLLLVPNECKQVLNIPKEILNDNERQRRVYSPDGISPAVLARNDNAKILQVGMLNMKGSEQIRRVYDPKGIAPTLDTCGGGDREPKIICNKNELVFIGGTTKKDWAKDGKKLSRNFPQGERVYDSEGIACSQTAQGGGTGSYTGLYLEKNKETKKDKIIIDKSIKPSVAKNFEREKEEILKSNKEIYQCECNGGWQDNKVGLKTSPTIRANNNHTSALDNNYRIRKLTPLECWRLMGFNDEDYWKARKALEEKYYNGKDRSNSQMYKQAGNSIVVDVLEHIFVNLFS